MRKLTTPLILLLSLWLSLGLAQPDTQLMGDALLQQLMTSIDALNTQITTLEDKVTDLEGELQARDATPNSHVTDLQAEIEDLRSELQARTSFNVYYRGVTAFNDATWRQEHTLTPNPTTPLMYNEPKRNPRTGDVLKQEDDPNLFQVERKPLEVTFTVKRPCTILMIANGHHKTSESLSAYLTFYVDGRRVGHTTSDVSSLPYPESSGFFEFTKSTAWDAVTLTQSHQITQEYFDDNKASDTNSMDVVVDLRAQGSVGKTYFFNGLGMQVIPLGCE